MLLLKLCEENKKEVKLKRCVKLKGEEIKSSMIKSMIQNAKTGSRQISNVFLKKKKKKTQMIIGQEECLGREEKFGSAWFDLMSGKETTK